MTLPSASNSLNLSCTTLCTLQYSVLNTANRTSQSAGNIVHNPLIHCHTIIARREPWPIRKWMSVSGGWRVAFRHVTLLQKNTEVHNHVYKLVQSCSHRKNNVYKFFQSESIRKSPSLTLTKCAARGDAEIFSAQLWHEASGASQLLLIICKQTHTRTYTFGGGRSIFYQTMKINLDFHQHEI